MVRLCDYGAEEAPDVSNKRVGHAQCDYGAEEIPLVRPFAVGCLVKAYEARKTTQIRCLRIPEYLFDFQECISAVQMLI